jgi:hypothetical protein
MRTLAVCGRRNGVRFGANLVLLGTVGLCAVTVSRDARADWYSDAKDIVQQLVEDDIATQAVPNAASRIQAICDYFPSTVAALEDKRYDGLPPILRKEVADAVGYVVLTNLATLAAAPPGPAATPPAGAPAPALMTAGAPAGGAPAGPPPAVALAARTRKAPDAKGFVNLDEVRPLLKLGLPDAAMAAKAQPAAAVAAGPAAAGAPAPKIQASSSSSGSGDLCTFPSQATAKRLQKYSRWVARKQANPNLKQSAPEDHAPVQPVPESKATAALRLCLPPQKDIGSEISCAAALLTRDAVNGDTKLLPSDLRRLAAATIVEGAAVLEKSTKTDADLVTLATKVGAVLASPTGDSIADAVCTGLAVPDLATCKSTLAADIDPLLAHGVALNVATLEQALGLVQAIAQQWQTKVGAGGGTLPKVLTYVQQIATGTLQVVKDVQAKDYGAAAGDVMGTVEEIVCEDDNGDTLKAADGSVKPGCSYKEQTVYQFLQVLAVYSVDSLTSGTTTTVDANFRKAAVDMIEAWSGAGVRRNLLHNAEFAYIPEFALRDAWRPGHIGTTSSQLLVYPSVDLLRGRIKIPVGRTFYLGVHGSLLDPLGPLMEVSTRTASWSPSDKNLTSAFLLGFVVPRVDIEFGVPDLTKNLTIGVGGAMRFVRAEAASDGATYCIVGSTCVTGTSAAPTWNNAELSVFVKYVP